MITQQNENRFPEEEKKPTKKPPTKPYDMCKGCEKGGCRVEQEVYISTAPAFHRPEAPPAYRDAT